MLALTAQPELLAADPLLERYRQDRDEASLQEIMREHVAALRAVARRVLRRADLIEDAVQEAFVRLVHARDGIRGPLGPWLRTVALNAALDLLRCETRMRRLHEDFAREAGLHQSRPQLDQEARRLIAESIATLGETHRAVIARSFFLGRTQAEIAEEDGISQVAVHKRMRQALGALRRRIIRAGIDDCLLAIGRPDAGASAAVVPLPGLLPLLALAMVGAAWRMGARAGLSCAALCLADGRPGGARRT